MTTDVHLLTAGDLRQCTVVCGARLPERGTWHRALVTCAACLRMAPAAPAHGPAMPEKVLQEQVRQLCEIHGWIYFHVWNSRHSPSGFPDIVAIRGERLVAAELKRAGQEPTPAQTRWLEAFRQVHIIETSVWRPDDWPTIMEELG